MATIIFRQNQKRDVEQWLKNRCRGGWFWDPGLGKTTCAIVVLKRAVDLKLLTNTKRTLVLMPSSLRSMWKEDCLKYGISEEEIYEFKPTDQVRKKDPPIDMNKHRIFLLGYELMVARNKLWGVKKKGQKSFTVDKDKPLWPFLSVDMIICDEAHALASHKTRAHRMVKHHTDDPNMKVLLLSGTPFPKGYIDTFPVMDIIKPGSLGHNVTAFRAKYCFVKNPTYFIYAVRKDMQREIDEQIFKVCSFRDINNEVDIPANTDITLTYPLTEKQRHTLREAWKEKVLTASTGQRIPIPQVVTRMMIARQIMSGFIDIDVTIKVLRLQFQISQDLHAGGLIPKEEILRDTLLGFPKTRQMLIWINFKETAKRLDTLFTEWEIPHAVIVGDTAEKDRVRILAEYKEGKYSAIIAHPRTLGVGVNDFIETQYMFWYEMTDRYVLHDQACARISRIGQRFNTMTYYFIGEKVLDKVGSIDARMMEALKLKQDVMDYFMKNFGEKDLSDSEVAKLLPK